MIARVFMLLACASLGPARRDWAEAMVAEFDAAARDDRALPFAAGCLIGAWRTLPDHAEGRLVLASYTLALGLLLPVAATLALAAAFGFPFVEAGDGFSGFVSGSGARRSLLNAGSFTVAPSLSLTMLVLAACHLPLAWWVLDRDWAGVARATRMGAAAITTLAIVTSCVAISPLRLLLPIGALAIEFAAIAALAAWAGRLSHHGLLIEGANH